jgi:2,3-bisphosphoglycerate-dependent phosphoglycerate mutase
MRKILIVVSILMFGICELSAQKTIYYLVRHAEKDTSVAGATMMQANPPLSEKGIQRSTRLASLLEKENIDYIFSTKYLRTQSTAQPLATLIGKEIQFYEISKGTAFSDSIQQMPFLGKTLLIIGHSNTIPPLVNALIKTNKYQNLSDNEYGFIYKVIMESGQIKDTVLMY